MSLASAALQQSIREAEARVILGEKPRDPFERVLFAEAREQMAERAKRA